MLDGQEAWGHTGVMNETQAERDAALMEFGRNQKAQADARKLEESARKAALHTRLEELHAPAIYFLIRNHLDYLGRDRTSRVSNANLTWADARGQLDGWVSALAMVFGAGVGEVHDMLSAYDINYNEAFAEVRNLRINHHVALPDCIRNI